MRRKSAEQIIWDDVKRKRLRKAGFGLLLSGGLFLLAIPQFDLEGAAPAGAVALGLVVVLVGFVMFFASLAMPHMRLRDLQDCTSAASRFY